MLCRLHGTYLPPSLTRHQRDLPDPLPDQPLLQDKLALSRIQQFASILFHRPSEREMSRFERALLAVLWPAAVGFLALAISEVIRTVLEGEGGSASSAGLPNRQLGGATYNNGTEWQGSAPPVDTFKPWTAYIPQVSIRKLRLPGPANPARSSR